MNSSKLFSLSARTGLAAILAMAAVACGARANDDSGNTAEGAVTKTGALAGCTVPATVDNPTLHSAWGIEVQNPGLNATVAVKDKDTLDSMSAQTLLCYLTDTCASYDEDGVHTGYSGEGKRSWNIYAGMDGAEGSTIYEIELASLPAGEVRSAISYKFKRTEAMSGTLTHGIARLSASAPADGTRQHQRYAGLFLCPEDIYMVDYERPNAQWGQRDGMVVNEPTTWTATEIHQWLAVNCKNPFAGQRSFEILQTVKSPHGTQDFGLRVDCALEPGASQAVLEDNTNLQLFIRNSDNGDPSTEIEGLGVGTFKMVALDAPFGIHRGGG